MGRVSGTYANKPVIGSLVRVAMFQVAFRDDIMQMNRVALTSCLQWLRGGYTVMQIETGAYFTKLHVMQIGTGSVFYETTRYANWNRSVFYETTRYANWNMNVLYKTTRYAKMEHERIVQDYTLCRLEPERIVTFLAIDRVGVLGGEESSRQLRP